MTFMSKWNLVHKIQRTAESTDEFWSEDSHIKIVSEEERFTHNSKLATSLLSLSFPNSSVERSFSIMNAVKNKLRNETSIKTAEAILRMKDNLSNSASFEHTKSMLKKCCSSEMYYSIVGHSVTKTLSQF